MGLSGGSLLSTASKCSIQIFSLLLPSFVGLPLQLRMSKYGLGCQSTAKDVKVWLKYRMAKYSYGCSSCSGISGHNSEVLHQVLPQEKALGTSLNGGWNERGDEQSRFVVIVVR